MYVDDSDGTGICALKAFLALSTASQTHFVSLSVIRSNETGIYNLNDVCFIELELHTSSFYIDSDLIIENNKKPKPCAHHEI